MSSAGIAVSHYRVDQVLSPVRTERSYLDEFVLIYLTFPGSPAMPMRVLESDSIASVKLRIQSSKGFAVKNQKLVFDGRELTRNDWLVRDYGLSDGNVIHLLIRPSDLRLIAVTTACGKKFELQVEQNRNVAYIKDQIANKGKDFADIRNQKLVCDGEELDDRLLINDICKNNDSVIKLSIRKRKKDDDSNKVTGKPFDRQSWIAPVIVNPKVKLSPILEEMMSAVDVGLEKRIKPVMSSEGSGGVYFMKEGSGCKNVAVFKPIDEEPMAENNPRGLPLSRDGEGLKKGTRVGEGALREVAAYILDHPASGRRSFLSDEPGFSGVPPTAMVQCLRGFDDAFEPKDFKMGSLQMFVKNCGSCEDLGPRAFPVEEVHKIAVLDLRLVNADRHAGNILLCREGEAGKIMLVPIDHGYCLPEHFEDCTFDWLFWPQARQPFDSRTLDYIKTLDAEKDLALLKFYGWEPSLECSRTFLISTMLLKKGAERRLTPYEIGNILCRETINKQSKIEEMIFKAMDSVLPGSTEAAFLEKISEIMDHYLDKLTSA
ncbi:phosphatidylinositol 4-kinase gamma 4 [Dendrobium catenatum]|uniref:1-phosphatidylinositol 4-kinase n=1 Tax=Dendrobium catenatum TaxID=906689 RepID=A0A2I0W1B2_9ASPA|nr:phosphatidylinositol 4-kinase gamma 4 [Dendrobium catenatum]PKU69445.1 putative phosphatidylinositol 4-kinase type 2-beta [Dendrobium catenatum]